MPKSKSINKTESFVDLDAKEEDIYESIAHELDKKKIKKGVWAKATAEADGDENKTKAIYIKYRYSQLIKNS